MNESKEITAYPKKSAGRVMVSNVPTVEASATIADIEKLLLTRTSSFENINYIYVVNNRGKLVGVSSIKEIFRSKKEIPIETVMVKEVIKVYGHTDQERAALLALKHNIKTVPVVDRENTFLGSIPSDTILQILDNEAVENILRFGGVIHSGRFDNVLDISLLKSLAHRLPWLILGLFGGLVIASIVSGFESVLVENLILAAFIPLVVYMSGATGAQMQALIIRDLAIHPKLNFVQYFFRQIFVVVFIGLCVSVLLYIISSLLYADLWLSMVLTLALFFAVLSSVVTGLLIPYTFERLGLDPANASGPVATIIQDMLSVFIYFAVALVLL